MRKRDASRSAPTGERLSDEAGALRTGDAVSLLVSDLDDDGAGVGPVGEVEVHVAGALPGERVAARIEHRSPHALRAWARLERLLEPSDLRVTPVCAAYGACGGCTLQHLSYSAQRDWKRKRVMSALRSTAQLASQPVLPCVAAPTPLGYRNRSKLVVGGSAGAVRLGGFAPRSHDLVDLDGCRVVDPLLDAVARTLRPLLDASGLAPYDERDGSGLLRHVVLRASARREVLAVVVTTGESATPPRPALLACAEALRSHHPEVVGVVENLHRLPGNAIFGPTSRPLSGAAHLVDTVGQTQLHLSATAFFQINRPIAEQLYDEVVVRTAPLASDVVVDCYSGVGGIALALAPHVAEVVGIEEHAGAVEDAARSAALSKRPNARFVTGDVALELARLDRADVAVVNPPRKGCSQQVLEELCRLSPRRVIYVSCNPDTLARDLDTLVARGYRVEQVQPFDMLPQTPHVEVLAVLVR